MNPALSMSQCHWCESP